MTAEPNPAQAEAWNNAGGRTWVELQETLDALFAGVAAELVAATAPSAGARFLDIGCGAGATTLAMARRAACLGADISAPLIEAAKRRAAAEGVAGATFVVGDAQVHPFEAEAFDGVISRFGVMFFDDPVAAFRNIRTAVRPGGALTFVAWRSPAENPFMTTAARAAAPFLPSLPAPAPDAPGQFGLARRARIEQVLADSGWSDIDVRPLDLDAVLPEPDLATYVARMGPVGAALQALDAPDRARASQTVLRAFAPFVRDGAARFNLACWLVSARA